MENQNFKVGDRVFDPVLKKCGGKVVSTSAVYPHPIEVSWDDGHVTCYHPNGTYLNFNTLHTLFKGEYQEMEIVPKGAAIHQRVIQVRDYEHHEWENRVLIKFLPDGRPLCWVNAKTIEDAKSKKETRFWKFWQELPELKTPTAEEIAQKIGITVDELKKIVQQC